MATKNSRVPLIEACRTTKVPYRVAWEAIASGKLVAKRKGSRWLVHPTDLKRAVDESHLVSA